MKEDKVPYFCWDRKLTEHEIKEQLRTFEGRERDSNYEGHCRIVK